MTTARDRAKGHVRAVVAEMGTELESLTDADLVDEWTDAGRRLLAIDAKEFRERLQSTCTDFPKPEPTIENWTAFGQRLASRDRKVFAQLIVLTNARADHLEEDRLS